MDVELSEEVKLVVVVAVVGVVLGDVDACVVISQNWK